MIIIPIKEYLNIPIQAWASEHQIVNFIVMGM